MSGLDLDAIDADLARPVTYVATACRWAPSMLDEIRRLRSDLAAARAEADALRGLVGEACDLIDGGGAYCGDCGIGQSSSDIRARAEKAGGR